MKAPIYICPVLEVDVIDKMGGMQSVPPPAFLFLDMPLNLCWQILKYIIMCIYCFIIMKLYNILRKNIKFALKK